MSSRKLGNSRLGGINGSGGGQAPQASSHSIGNSRESTCLHMFLISIATQCNLRWCKGGCSYRRRQLRMPAWRRCCWKR